MRPRKHRPEHPRWATASVRLLGLLAALQAAAAGPAGAQSSATYELEFRGRWSGEHVEGGALPERAHFTALIGATHAPGLPLWEPGGFASLALEEVAENGNAQPMIAEIEDRIAQGDAGEIVETGSINNFPRIARSEFVATLEHPELSTASMVAPSPDWFLGVSGLALRDAEGWIDEMLVDLVVWDAGTEDGSGYSLSNRPTDPIEPISMRGSPFLPGALIGRLRVLRVPEAPNAAAGACALGALLVLRRRAPRIVRGGRPGPCNAATKTAPTRGRTPSKAEA